MLNISFMAASSEIRILYVPLSIWEYMPVSYTHLDIMNYVGYDFAVPGNHEFDYGMSRFLELAGKLNCGYYSCNFIDSATGAPVFAPYKMFTYGATQVAFVGVTTPESFTKSTPAYFQDSQGNYIYSFCEDESGQKLYDQVQASVDAARTAGADYVILAGHLGENGITQKWSSVSVIANTTGIDACIDCLLYTSRCV